ncbi:uncharacterized protein LOC108108285 [Drosophila eugracilis]|uniref:uncharacterized protein LOC108108285 n=1 Tax=Drosophila eugracilis TaxID=29029 RepID=UPI0007E6A8A2|nr:uncharacterized protein LOC108108285 [Drosophila eugracilis]
MSFVSDNSDSDDKDSFHSFNNSESFLDNLSLSDSDCDSADISESRSEYETSTENTIEEPCKPTFLYSILKPMSSRFDVNSNDSSACDGLSAAKDKFNISPLGQSQETDPVQCCPRNVPEPISKRDQPAAVLQQHLITNTKEEAMQKYAFTEIWIGLQQKSLLTQSSCLGQFSAALEAYFNNDFSKKKSDTSLEEIEKDLETSAAPSKMYRTEEYVPSFPLKPPVAPAPKVPSPLKGIKPPSTDPAGFDLTQFVEMKNTNHWKYRPQLSISHSIF